MTYFTTLLLAIVLMSLALLLLSLGLLLKGSSKGALMLRKGHCGSPHAQNSSCKKQKCDNGTSCQLCNRIHHEDNHENS